jgi:hypothetical protein
MVRPSAYPAVAEQEDRANERIVLESLLAEPGQTIDPPPKIDRLEGDEDLHLGRDLEHQRASQKLRETASTSATS